MAASLNRANSYIDVSGSQPFGYADSYYDDDDEVEKGEPNSPLIIDEKRQSNPFIDDEAKEAEDEYEEVEMEEDPVDEQYYRQVEESERMAAMMAKNGAGQAGAEADVVQRLPEHYEQDFKDNWEILDLRDINEVDAAQDRLVDSKGWIPPPEKNEVACFHLGGLDFVHVYEVPEADHGIKMDLSQWIFTDEDSSNDEARYGLRLSTHGLALTWDEWTKVLQHRKKVLYLMFRVVHDRLVDEKFPLGGEGNKFISVTHPFWVVNLRVWFQRDNQGPFFPGRKGLSLKFQHYRRLLELEDIMWYHRDILEVRKQEHDEKKRKIEEEQALKAKEVNIMKTTDAVRPKTLQKAPKKGKNLEAQKAREAAKESLKKQMAKHLKNLRNAQDQSSGREAEARLYKSHLSKDARLHLDMMKLKTVPVSENSAEKERHL